MCNQFYYKLQIQYLEHHSDAGLIVYKNQEKNQAGKIQFSQRKYSVMKKMSEPYLSFPAFRFFDRV